MNCKMKCHITCLLVILFCFGCGQRLAAATEDEDSWIDPDAWGRENHLQNTNQIKNNLQVFDTEENSKRQNNNRESPGEDAVALMYYKRLIAYLFNNNTFKYNDLKKEYTRALVFTVSPAQLEKLNELNDPRDLDEVLTQILSKTQAPTADQYYCVQNNKSTLRLIWDITKDLLQLLKHSEVQFLLGTMSALMIGWYWHRKNQIRISTLIIGAVVCFGYFHTYLECNRKLEAERMLELLEDNERNEPKWYTSIVNLFSSWSSKQAKNEYLKRASRINLNFCRPDHVLLLYANDLILKQLTFLIDKTAEAMDIIKNKLSFPFNYLGDVFLVLLIGYIIKLTFKYILSPRAWAGIWYARQSGHDVPHHGLLSGSTGTTHREDCISGENLKMLLNAISGASMSAEEITINHTSRTATTTQTVELPSGVQEILPPIENGDTEKECEPNDKKKSDNNNETAKEPIMAQ